MQGHLVTAALGDVLDDALVVKQGAIEIAYRVGVFGNPDACAVAAVDFRFKIGHLAVALDQFLEFGAAQRVHIQAAADVLEAGDQNLGAGVAVEFSQRLVNRQIAAAFGTLEHPDDRILENAAIAEFRIRQLQHGQYPLGYVFEIAVEHGGDVVTPVDHASLADPFLLAVAGDDPVLQRITLTAFDGGEDGAAHDGAVFRVGQIFQ